MTENEQAILKTLVYSNIFQYPLKKEEIFDYLIEKKVSNAEFNKALVALIGRKLVGKTDNYYYIYPQKSLVQIRQKRADISRKKIAKAKKWVSFLKLNPYLKMVAITGTLAMENADINDDIDLILVFSTNRLFLGRLVEYLILKLIGKRRNPGQQKAQDMLCPNVYLSKESLEIHSQNLFIAHEITQMKLLWDREQTYKQFLKENQWLHKFLPNWGRKFQNEAPRSNDRGIFSSCFVGAKSSEAKYSSLSSPILQSGYFAKEDKSCTLKTVSKSRWTPFDLLEEIVRKLQLKYMQSKISSEKISDTALYFHPHDVKEKIMEKYQSKLKEFGLI